MALALPKLLDRSRLVVDAKRSVVRREMGIFRRRKSEIRFSDVRAVTIYSMTELGNYWRTQTAHRALLLTAHGAIQVIAHLEYEPVFRMASEISRVIRCDLVREPLDGEGVAVLVARAGDASYRARYSAGGAGPAIAARCPDPLIRARWKGSWLEVRMRNLGPTFLARQGALLGLGIVGLTGATALSAYIVAKHQLLLLGLAGAIGFIFGLTCLVRWILVQRSAKHRLVVGPTHLSVVTRSPWGDRAWSAADSSIASLDARDGAVAVLLQAEDAPRLILEGITLEGARWVAAAMHCALAGVRPRFDRGTLDAEADGLPDSGITPEHRPAPDRGSV